MRKTATAQRTSNVLTEAASLVFGPRQADYGPPIDNFSDEALAFTAYLRARKLVAGTSPVQRNELSPRDVAMLNILQKVIRDGNVPKRDNLVDIAGYALTAERLDERRK